MKHVFLLSVLVFRCGGIPMAGPTRSNTTIVVWNADAAVNETIHERLGDFAQLGANTAADVIILVEMRSETSVARFVDQLGWPEVHYAVSKFSQRTASRLFTLEMAVISKLKIENAIEYDTSHDHVHWVRDQSGQPILTIDEIELKSDGIPDFGQRLARTDRGTLRVDLENGLSIFPVHLKSDRVSSCFHDQSSLELTRENGIQVSTEPPQTHVDKARGWGFPQATKERRSNAVKRERVIAAVARVAQEAIDDGRYAVIAGDFNTAYEPGKKGEFPEDCALADFGCAKAPFPASACSDGDGYDDTFAILERGYAAPTKWQVLSSRLKRTFADEAFADAAIDHIAVPIESVSKFSQARRIDELYGSDHYPITATFKN